jgi:hypothetical protein
MESDHLKKLRTKVNLREICCDSGKWMEMAQYYVQ